MKHEILLSCPPIIRDFLTYNETIKGKSSKSVDEYYLDLQTFFRYLLLIRGKVDKKSNFDEIDISCVDAELISTVTISDLYSFIVFKTFSFIIFSLPPIKSYTLLIYI